MAMPFKPSAGHSFSLAPAFLLSFLVPVRHGCLSQLPHTSSEHRVQWERQAVVRVYELSLFQVLTEHLVCAGAGNKERKIPGLALSLQSPMGGRSKQTAHCKCRVMSVIWRDLGCRGSKED